MKIRAKCVKIELNVFAATPRYDIRFHGDDGVKSVELVTEEFNAGFVVGRFYEISIDSEVEIGNRQIMRNRAPEDDQVEP